MLNSSFCFHIGIPLTVQNVTIAIKNVEWDSLCQCLLVSKSKRSEIEAQHPVEDHRKVLIEWWFLNDLAPSWRRLIQRLDCFGSSSWRGDDSLCGYVADTIRHNAEPVQGMFSSYTSGY